MREFRTGATRDQDTTKFDYDGFISPYALRRFAEYMHKHRIQSDGSMRDSDNWQKGIPLEAYRKSGWRHWFDVWCLLKGLPELSGQATDQGPQDLEEALCGVLFNVQGLLHETVKARMEKESTVSRPPCVESAIRCEHSCREHIIKDGDCHSRGNSV